MGNRVPASLSPVPLFSSDQPVAVNDPTDVDKEHHSSKTDADESVDEEDSRIHLVM